ncbi:MAG TPA: Rne/Rng family ribonuclease [Stellaceae bacterium]
MAKRMLIDATHPEETRVVVLNGNRLEEFDFESSTKQQVKGNIYLAKVTRVEPSLQASFVEYGGNRHGFLAFSEIHPDYFRIPVGDRETSAGGGHHAEPAGPPISGEAADDVGVPLAAALPEPVAVIGAPTEAEDRATEESAGLDEPLAGDAPGEIPGAEREAALEWPPGAATGPAPDGPAAETPIADSARSDLVAEAEARSEAARAERPWEDVTPFVPVAPDPHHLPPSPEPPSPEPPSSELISPAPERELGETVGYAALRSDNAGAEAATAEAEEWVTAASEDELLAGSGETALAPQARAPAEGENGEAEIIETIGGDEFEEAERQRSRAPRHYKIQEVVKRRQIMLVQVTKEERGNKGAALTTYLSLAGRYCVLMPNTARGGGVSRKITSITDRRRLKDILEELDIPEGMGVIVRTAGAERSKAEIKRDYEYLLRLWNEIRELTLQSTAPALIYEEGNLIKRSIRDLYTRDIDEVLVEGEDGYRTAKAFMKMLMPSHAKRVQPYRDPQIGLLHRFQVESQIDAIHSPIVQLRSGGYVVINQTEALVAIDVNSGRSTRERNIEETALRTNLEAAEEIARQLRLRDLAGLIVIDFIDMEEHRNNGAVERRLKDALKNDRARIQVGRISPFGLLEMSRQRLRPSLVEASTQPCPHCGGTGFIRSTESTALYVLRSIEEEGMRRRSAEVCVYVPTTVALYILNHKRDSLAQLETRYGVHVLVARDDALIPPAFRLERLRSYEPGDAVPVAMVPLTQTPEIEEEEAGDEDDGDTGAGEMQTATAEQRGQEDEEERGRGRRRRRRRRRHDDDRGARAAEEGEEPIAATAGMAAEMRDGEGNDEDDHGEAPGDDDKLRRRRGRRGGRRRGRREEGAGPSFDDPRAASLTVEIAVTPSAGDAEDGAFAAEGAEQASAPATWPWPDAPADAVSLAGPMAAAEMETASLPALAGEATPQQSEQSAGLENAENAPQTTLDAGDAEQGPVERGPVEHGGFSPALTGARELTGERGDELRPPVPDGAAEPRAAAEDERQEEHGEDERAHSPAASNGPDAPAASEPQPQPVPTAQTVAQKPPSPRKGWWQRLIQS